MAAKRYSAGAIFLQVVPVFANVQNAIEDEAKNIDRALGDQMEKSGHRAGERAGKAASEAARKEIAKGSISDEMQREVQRGVDHMDRALAGVDTRNLGKKLRGEVKAMRADLESLRGVDLHVDDNLDKVRAKVAAVREQIEDMRKRSKVFFDVDGLPDVYRACAQIEKAIQGIDTHLTVDVDTRGAERKMGSFERAIKSSMDKAAKHIDGSVNKQVRRLKDELDYLSKLRVGVDIGATQLKREVGEIMAELEHLAHSDPEVDVRFDAGKAKAELTAFMEQVDRADRKRINVHADVDTDRARRGLFRLTRSGDDAANSFRSFNIVLLAAAGAGPALVPMLGAIAGGLLAIGPAAAVAGAGLASVLIGFSGISDAVDALQKRDEEAGHTATQSARTQRDAAQAVADARRSAADQIESALDRQRDAQERYRDSIDDVREAEEALREAREAAKGTGDDIKDRIKDNELARDQALLDVFNATVTYDSTMADGSATNAEQEQARINLETAKRRLEELREEQKTLAKEKRKWDREGVDGTEEVQSAQDRLNDAIEAQKDAYEDLGEAAEAVDRARADGARQVARALQAQRDAMADVSTQQRNVQTEFDKLGLAGQQFALFIHGLRDEFYAFRDDIQSVLLPAVQRAIEGFMGSDSGAAARAALIALAEDFGRFTEALSASFQGDAWLGFFEMLRDLGPDIQAAYGDAFISFLEAMASILTTLAPFALDFAEGFARLMDSFNQWAQSEAGQKAIQDFMEYMEKVGPGVLDFIGALAGAFGNLLVALAPYGETILHLLTNLLEYIAAMDPKILGAIVTGIIVLITASQVAYAVMNFLMAGAALLTSTIGVVVFALVALGLVVAYLWKTNEDFRNFMKDAWDEIGSAVKDAWDRYLKPALMDLWDAVQELWDEVLEPFFKWLGPIIVQIAKVYFPLLLRWWGLIARGIAWTIRNILIPVFKAVGKFVMWLWKEVIKPTLPHIKNAWDRLVKAIKWAWNNILKPTWDAVSTAATWLWKNVLKPAFEAMGDAWDGLMDGMKWVWNNVLKPTWDFITDKALPRLKGAFETAVDGIKKVWDGLKKVVGAPIKFVLDTIINNGLIDGFNKVAGWVGMDGFKHIPIPRALQSYATGGVMPGYTPGRDVHSFYSPTAGRLELSGGEAVMRPEWTQAMGPGFVHQMNAIARNKGVKGVRSAMGMGGYWLGGVLPFPGASTSSHGSMYGHPAYDLNYPGYADYGQHVGAWKAGRVAQMNYIGDSSYGRWVVLNHENNQSSLYAHLSAFAQGLKVGAQVAAGQWIGNVGDLGNTGNPPTSHLHFEIMGGNVDYADNSAGGKKGDGGRSVPGFIKDLLLHPIDTVKEWATSKFDQASEFITGTPVWNTLKNVPAKLGVGFGEKAYDLLPGWAKSTVGAAADFAGAVKDVGGAVVGGVKDGIGAGLDAIGLAEGGILPYNGTMMYDNGGYLPPGLTTVMNLTGKPEPVFTNEQWSDIEGGGTGGGIHYEPHFEGSDLTAEDVAGDLNFQFRKMRRAGKYEGVGR